MSIPKSCPNWKEAFNGANYFFPINKIYIHIYDFCSFGSLINLHFQLHSEVYFNSKK